MAEITAGDEARRLRRRQLLRTGAALAGAGIAGSTLAAQPAHAADGDSLTLGQDNDADSGTSLTVGGGTGSPAPALSITNSNGPSLYLNPLPDAWNGNLEPGQIANTMSGPLIGVTHDGIDITTQLLTEQDVWLPFVLPTPMRLVDTRSAQGRERITLPSPLDSAGRLPAGQTMTFWIAPAGQGFGIPGVHINLTLVRPESSGYAVAYPGPDRPPTSTVNFVRGQIVANGAFIGTSVGTHTVSVDPSQPPQEVEVFAMSVYTSATAWVVVDATGAFATGFNPVAQTTSATRRRLRSSSSPRTRAMSGFGRL